MIPGNLFSTMRLDTDVSVQPAPAARSVVDVLGSLVPGQRLMALIQGQMANGAYRAQVGQREVTLSLPFTASAGDTLELEVIESNGKTALAFVARESGQAPPGQQQGAAVSNLSRTGVLIAELLGRPSTPSGTGNASTEGRALPLNGNQPLAAAPPGSGAAATLAPLLQQAIARSGMFYEAHLAQWIGGKVSEAALRAEPQGQLSLPPQAALASSPAGAAGAAGTAGAGAAAGAGTAATATATPAAAAAAAAATTAATAAGPAGAAAGAAASAATNAAMLLPAAMNAALPLPEGAQPADATAQAPATTPNAALPNAPLPPNAPAQSAATAAAAAAASAANPAAAAAVAQQAPPPGAAQEILNAVLRPLAHLLPGQIVAPEVTHLVQQQRESLATQNYVWQGQAWPGQSMRWEIEEEERREQEGEGGDGEPQESWRTRLTLRLPQLGGIDAVLRLTGGDVTLGLAADSAEAISRMGAADAVELLRNQFEAAGLHLAGVEIREMTPESEATALDEGEEAAQDVREPA